MKIDQSILSLALLVAMSGVSFSQEQKAADPVNDAIEQLERAAASSRSSQFDSRAIEPANGKASPATLVSTTPAVVKVGEPAPAPAPAQAPKETVWALDPRDRINSEEGAKEGYESTSLAVQRVFWAVGTKDGAAAPEWKKRIPTAVPVLYQTRLLRLDQAHVARARDVLQRLKAIDAKAQALKKESAAALAEWNEIVGHGTPEAVLAADSPSLASNQGVGSINRSPSAPGFTPAEDITYALAPAEKKEQPKVEAAGPVSVRIYEPSVPKFVGQSPDGWKLEKLPDHSVEAPAIPLPNGQNAAIKPAAYCLIPVAAPGVVILMDPGYTEHHSTIGAVLTEQAEGAGLLHDRLSHIAELLEAALQPAARHQNRK